MGGRGNSGSRNSSQPFSLSAVNLKMEPRDIKDLERDVNDIIRPPFYDQDTISVFSRNIPSSDRDKISQSITAYIKANTGYDVDVRIYRKVEAGSRSRLRGGGSKGKTYWTYIDYRRK